MQQYRIDRVVSSSCIGHFQAYSITLSYLVLSVIQTPVNPSISEFSKFLTSFDPMISEPDVTDSQNPYSPLKRNLH